MSLLPVEDSDPLLSFSSEPGGPASKPADSLLARVEHLERELATLVRTVNDIRNTGRTVAAPARAVKSSRSQTTRAIAGLIIGASISVFGWMYLGGDSDLTMAAPPAVAAQTIVPEPQSTTPSPVETAGLAPLAPAPQAPRAPQARQGTPAPQAPRYVGTLSIDAKPGGDVFLNRESAGHTPLRLTGLRAGSHLIWIERDGYRRWTRVVQVPADRVTRLFAELEPIAAR
ncbi:MAG: PEGA domain-containing protein [Cyanobacteria bacterium]|nr:PEGA domain-containing protein [Cyanobacteriota bacterium]